MSVLEKVDRRRHRNLVSDGFDTASASRKVMTHVASFHVFVLSYNGM